jgi:hypothetical protein
MGNESDSMTSSDGKKRPNYTRRFIWLVGAIAVTIAAYTAGWFYVAGSLVDRVNAEVASLNGSGRRANCENAEARGYPFRIGIFCRSVLYEDAPSGIGLRARAFRSAAQVYAPGHVIAELDGPATIQGPGLSALDLDWSTLRASIRLSDPLPERISVEGREITAARDEAGGAAPPLGRAASAELHARPVGEDLDIALRFAKLTLEPELTDGVALPPLDGLLDLSIVAGARLLLADPASLRGRTGTIRTLELSIDDRTGATLSGPVSVDAQGLVDADLELAVRNAPALAPILGDLFPESRNEIQMAVASFGAMGDVRLPLRIAGSEVSLGFLSLGTLPPL